jgi:ATP-dependent Lhr-like helicase
LLSSKGGRSILTQLQTVVLDEVHGVFGSKRGVHLMSAVERLVRLSGEFQRISLSATIRPLSTVAEFVGGSILEGDKNAPRYRKRAVTIVESRADKRYDIRIHASDQPADPMDPEAVWGPMVESFKGLIRKNRSTLLFANSRRLAESLTSKINVDEPEPLAYSHHGSLSREIRTEVEAKLKAGDLKAIVATNSLEMGIDVGTLDEVVLIQAPRSISSAIQRVGRAGHSVGAVTRGSFYPTHQQDFLESAVLARGILDGDIEEIKPVQSPLDVLAQIIVSMTAMELWDVDELYAFLRTCTSFRDLGREPFDLVLNMLAGRYADSRIQELQPRISIDRIDNTVEARKGAIQVLYMAGGTIPDRGTFNLRHHETNARIGDLDEEFVWESDVGNTFTLGTQNWRVERITHNDVFVSPNRSESKMMPFWKGEGYHRDFHFSESIARFLEVANDRVARPEFADMLQERYCLTPEATQRLVTLLKEQKSRTQQDLPHRHHLLVEAVDSGPEGVPGNQVVLHTLWGGRVNVPYALALDAAWEAKYDQRIEVFPSNDGISVMTPHAVEPEEILSLVTSSQVESLLRERLESSGFFGARFRECAGRSLVMTKSRMNERMPLWLSRLKSKKLLAAVSKYEDFPILLETWRTCLQDEFDLEHLSQMLAELEGSAIRWSFCKTNYPSPMAQSGAWRQLNQYMYMSDEPAGSQSSNLRSDLLRDAVFVAGLRPTVTRPICDRFEQKRQRLWPGYSPGSPRDLLDWLVERVAIPADEWDLLLEKIELDHEAEIEPFLEEIADKIVRVDCSGESGPKDATFVCALERVDRIVGAFEIGRAHV